MFDPTGLEGEYFQLPYTQKQEYFDVFSGPWWLTPFEAVANVGVFAGNSFIDITNTLTGGVNLVLYVGQNPNWNYELMDAIAYGPGKLSDETIYYFQNTSSEQIINDLKDSFTDPATYERALANFMILWVGYKSSVIKNQGNGLEGKQFDFDEVDDFVKESYDDLSAEGKQVVGEYVDDVENVRYMRGKSVSPTPKTLSDALNPEAYAYKVAKKFNINLRGSGQNVTIEFNPKLASEGLSSSVRPTVIQLGPTAFSDEVTLVNTIAHELNHARSWLVGGCASEEAAYAAGNALQAYIEGLK